MGPRFTDALVRACGWHETQIRKKTGRAIPYISHLLAVAALVLEDGGSEDEAIAALLHDTVEDQGVSPAQIADAYGDEVARIVVACSDSIGGPGVPKAPWLERKRRHLSHLGELGADHAVLRVTAADKLHNCRDLVADVRTDGVAALAGFRGGVEGTCWYYARMSELLDARFPASRLTGDLARETRVLHELVGVGFPAPEPTDMRLTVRGGT
jgi:(p)ppGpp synthase/HD superfamily hydrolase